MLKGKIAVVTGGSKGLGRHLAGALVAAGAKVASLARPSEENRQLESEYPDSVLALDGDIADPQQVNEAMERAASHFGNIDILVNNAAIFDLFRLEDATDDQIRRAIEVNLMGPAWCIRAAIPHLRKTRGHIVSISSESVRMPFPFLSLYAATKGGLEVLGSAMREELREHGIRVTTLRSGSIAGGSGAAGWDPAVAEEFFATIQRTGHAAFTGHAASPESMASALITALATPADINVDFLEVRAAEPLRADSIAQVQARSAAGKGAGADPTARGA